MSVLIKGMEMPKNCKECPLSDHVAWCLIQGSRKERYYCPDDERSDDCPLVEIPTPHGRLIDGDKFYEVMCSHWVLSLGEAYKRLEEFLKKPVIEAEGETDA